MSDTNPRPTTDADRAATREEALAWLAGQMRWETLLAELHDLGSREAAPVATLDDERREDGAAA
jgi:hypothetical protein